MVQYIPESSYLAVYGSFATSSPSSRQAFRIVMRSAGRILLFLAFGSVTPHGQHLLKFGLAVDMQRSAGGQVLELAAVADVGALVALDDACRKYGKVAGCLSNGLCGCQIRYLLQWCVLR